jgi:hypothetical protein
MTTSRSIEICFDGLQARVGPLTWSQRWSWDLVRDLAPEEHRINLAMRISLSGEQTVDNVTTAVVAMLARYESLRTTYQIGRDGEPEQVVHGRGAVPLIVRDAGGDPPDDVSLSLLKELSSWRFDLATQMPLRVGLVTVAGRAVAVAVALANMALDGWSADVLHRELTAQIRNGTAGTVRPTGYQPLDQAAYEASSVGQAVAQRGYAYWQEHLSALRSPPRSAWRPAGERPRFWCLEATSPALAHAGHVVARQLGVPASAVLLGGLSALIGLRKGQSSLLLSVIANNRYLPGTRSSVGKFFQPVPVLLDLEQSTFAEYVRSCSARMLRAVTFGRWDPRQLSRLVHGGGQHRGTYHALRVTFDYHPQLDPSAAELSSDVQVLRSLMASSALRWIDTAETELLQFYAQVHRFDHTSVIALWTDTRYLSRADLVSVVLGTERLLVEALATDVAMSEIAALTGVMPGLPADLTCATDRGP